MNRRMIAALVVLVVACRQPKDARPSNVGVGVSVDIPPPDASTQVVTAPGASAAADAGGPRSRRPLLVAALDHDLAAVLLSGEAPKAPAGKRPVLLQRDPIATAGVDLPASAWNDETRAAVADKYKLGAPASKGECVGTLDRVVDLSRIVAGDPTMSEGRLPDDALASEAFGKGAHSAAAIVRLSGSCKGVRWAVRDGAPAPERLALTPLDARAAARFEAILATKSDAYGSLPQTRDWKKKLSATRVGPRLVWTVAMRTQPGSPLMVCALVDPQAEPAKILAETSSCPETVEGATDGDGGLVVWFAHAFARVEDASLSTTYFPTATFAPYGAP